MQHEKLNWLKGNLPQWLVTALLTITCGLLLREVRRFEQLEVDARASSIRLAVVEEQVKEIRLGQAALLAETKSFHQLLLKR